jgi:thiol-disulfide isomerase/thioredoxin
MWARLSIVVGLLAGIATAALVLGGILAFAPEPAPPVTPAPSVVLASPTPTPPPSVTATASAAPGGSAVPSDDLAAALGVGSPAPSLVVPQVGGGTIDLANLKGSPVWVNFMGTYCPPCQDEFPLMNGFAARYADDGLVVLAIDVKEEEGVVAAFGDSLGATFPLGLDSDGSAAERWNATAALPVHFWIDEDGIVRDAAFGGIGADIMAQGLQTIMPDVTVTP